MTYQYHSCASRHQKEQLQYNLKNNKTRTFEIGNLSLQYSYNILEYQIHYF